MKTEKIKRSPLGLEGLSLELNQEEFLASIQDGHRELPGNLAEEDKSES